MLRVSIKIREALMLKDAKRLLRYRVSLCLFRWFYRFCSSDIFDNSPVHPSWFLRVVLSSACALTLIRCVSNFYSEWFLFSFSSLKNSPKIRANWKCAKRDKWFLAGSVAFVSRESWKAKESGIRSFVSSDTRRTENRLLASIDRHNHEITREHAPDLSSAKFFPGADSPFASDHAWSVSTCACW